MLPRAEMLVKDVKQRDELVEMSLDKCRDIEKWPRTSEPPTTEISVYAIDIKTEARLVRRIDLRLLPASMFIYLLCFIDRSNIGNAKILNSATGDSLAQTVHISDQQYLVALMIFLVAYVMFEIPSNYMLKRFSPSRWIALLMLCWGALTMALGAVHNFAQLVAIRFLLGAFEAGLFPGLIYCLTFWYKPEERAIRVALISATATLGGAFGGAIAFGVGQMNHVGGLEAWRWLFIIEGIPSVACAAAACLLFPDFPETAEWLSVGERELAVERIRGVASLGHARIIWKEAKETLTDWRLYLHYLAFISISVPFSSISLFAPTIVSGLGFEGLQAQLFTVPPYAIAFVVTIVVAWIADRYEMRSWAAFTTFTIAGVGYIAQGALPPDSFKARYGLLCVAVPFSFASVPPPFSWLTANLRNTGASTLAVPLNVSIGSLGQMVGIFIFKSSEAPGYPTGLFTNAAFQILGALCVLLLRVIYVRRNRQLASQNGSMKWRL